MGNNLIENNERGIEICHIEDDSFDPVKHGYKKVSKEALENFSLISRYVVNEVVQNSGAKEAEKMLEGAYKVVIKEGMHLGSSSTKKGAVKGLLFSDDKNALVGQADWITVVRKIEEYRVAKNSEAEYVKIGDSVYVKYIEKEFK